MRRKFPYHIFKAYDVRGIYPSELDENLAYRIGRSFVTLLKNERAMYCFIYLFIKTFNSRASAPAS